MRPFWAASHPQGTCDKRGQQPVLPSLARLLLVPRNSHSSQRVSAITPSESANMSMARAQAAPGSDRAFCRLNLISRKSGVSYN